MASPTIILPGDTLQSSTHNAPKLGPNLHLLSSQTKTQKQPPTTSESANTAPPIIASAQSGLLTTDVKRNQTTISVLPFPQTRYVPTTNDLVIAQIHHSSPEFFLCTITPQSPHAFLPHLSFEGATRKTRPQLKNGELVYARVVSVGSGAGAEVELACVNAATGKAEPGGLGPLTGGMVYDISVLLAMRLMMGGGAQEPEKGTSAGAGGVVVLEELGKKLEGHGLGGFEVAVGRNGRVWVDCSAGGDVGVKIIVAVGKCLRETDDRRLDVGGQKKLVSRVLRELELA